MKLSPIERSLEAMMVAMVQPIPVQKLCKGEKIFSSFIMCMYVSYVHCICCMARNSGGLLKL